MRSAFLVCAVGVLLSFDGAASAQSSLLDVPYMTQPAALCGGAAASMVLRYWGADDVFPQDFAPLVDDRAQGIPAARLAAALRDRGWQTYLVPADAGDRAWTEHLARGRPLIALIRVGPDAFHYVVIVGATRAGVVVHDPARAPFEVMAWDVFEEDWNAAERWMLLVLPGTDDVAPDGPTPDTTVTNDAGRAGTEPDADPSSPCSGLVDAGVEDARAGRLDDANRRLRAATAMCPGSAAAWRELAGLRFAASDWTEAAALAGRATRLAPADDYTWRLVATSRFLAGDAAGALAAWNEVGAPRVDTVTVTGVTRTRRPVVVDALGLEPREVLTPDTLARARRRLQDIPIAADAAVRYTVQGDEAAVTAAVSEPPVLPRGEIPIAVLAIRPLFVREVQVDVMGPTGSGERWTTAFRWPEPRRRVAVALAIPAPGALPGVLTIESAWERQTYALGDDVPGIREGRRRGAVRLADWATGWLHWDAGAAVDHLRDTSYAGVDAALEARLAGDRVALGWREGYWHPAGGGAAASAFARTTLHAAWRSTTRSDVARVTVGAESAAAGARAPLAIWPGADTGGAREAPIRAHPLLANDIVKSDGMIGRRLAAATIAYERPIRTVAGAGIGVAGFLDLARASQRAVAPDTIWEADAGIGARLHAAGLGGTARLDFAVGLRDGDLRVSAGWAPEWGGW